MIVYKFGGASIQNKDGIKNLKYILSLAPSDEKIVIVISAIGKTTNALEDILHEFCKGDKVAAIRRFEVIKVSHRSIINSLDLPKNIPLESLFEEFESKINTLNHTAQNYDWFYDVFVSYGEMFSTTIISEYLKSEGEYNHLIDMRKTLITDSRHREANIDFKISHITLTREISAFDFPIYLAQGFIGGNLAGETTTLGREGSDYTAAAIANILEARSVTIWKDVPGILNADPKIFDNTVLIEKLSYVDAVELAFSGAQIIHPKTIKPLQNKSIPLYVRPFMSPTSTGSVICETKSGLTIDYPIYILRKNQILISIRPKDFSFVLEECLPQIFALLNKHRQRVNLIHSSAIRVSVSVDGSPYFQELLEELNKDYKVKYNDSLQLLTMRGRLTPETIAKAKEWKNIFLEQRTRRSYKLLYNNA